MSVKVILGKAKTGDGAVVSYVTVLMRDVPHSDRVRLWDAVYEWCDDHFAYGTWSPQTSSFNTMNFWVIDEADAIAFKLRWNGVTKL